VRLLGQCEYVCVGVCVFVYAQFEAARSNLEPAVCNRERRRTNLYISISKAISLLIKLRAYLYHQSQSVCVCVCVCDGV